MNPFPLVLATLRRNRFSSILFVSVIALAVALGIAISAQERALRQGSARAADRFDLIVAAPGSQADLLFSVVYLDPRAVELLSPEMTANILQGDRADFAAPIGFGDNYNGDPVVGTTSAFVDHLSRGLESGQLFARIDEAVVGALSPNAIGDRLAIRHGHGDGAGQDADNVMDARENGGQAVVEEEGHNHIDVTVVGRMKPTGTPWDRAIVVPVEYNWFAHGMGTGHAPGDERIGPPYEAEHLPGVPAIVMKPENVAAAYGLRNRYRTIESTAFFPAEVLVELYSVMGNVARIMGVLTLAAQILVVTAILAGILALLDLQRQRFAMLRALGAPARFIFAVVWLYVGGLIASGALIGLPLGWAAASVISSIIASQTGVSMAAHVGASELALVGALLALGMLLALVPAALTYRKPVVEALR
jgi:putative ABC transport system permease protein